MKELHVATVSWFSPRHKRYAPPEKMLSLCLETEELKPLMQLYEGFNNDGAEQYLFNSKAEAEQFKTQVTNWYAAHPQYFVIDGDGNQVLDEGQPIVAWTPEIEVSPISLAQAKATFSEACFTESDTIQ